MKTLKQHMNESFNVNIDAAFNLNADAPDMSFEELMADMNDYDRAYIAQADERIAKAKQNAQQRIKQIEDELNDELQQITDWLMQKLMQD